MKLTKPERDRLRRFVCWWCDQPLHRDECAAVDEPCTAEDREKRRQSCLAAARPRRMDEQTKRLIELPPNASLQEFIAARDGVSLAEARRCIIALQAQNKPPLSPPAEDEGGVRRKP